MQLSGWDTLRIRAIELPATETPTKGQRGTRLAVLGGSGRAPSCFELCCTVVPGGLLVR